MGKPPGPCLHSGAAAPEAAFRKLPTSREDRPPVPLLLPGLPKRRTERSAASFSDMMPSKTQRKPNPTPSECSVVIALQLRRIGDKWNLRQRILNLFSKLFCPGT